MFKKAKKKQEALKSSVLVEIKGDDAQSLTGIELRKKITRLAGYIKRTEGKIAMHKRKLKERRDIKASEKKKIKEGLQLLKLKEKEALEL